MAAVGGAGRGPGKGIRTKGVARKTKPPKLPIGRPVRLAHLVSGSDRQMRRERASLASVMTAMPASSPRPGYPTPSPHLPPPPVKLGDVLCLPNPEWLPHELTVTGPSEELAAFRLAAAGPGAIPWVTDYDRQEEDWVHAMLTPPPTERGISVEGARILARQLRERVEMQDQHVASAAFDDARCPLDLNALVPVPDRMLRLGPDDPGVLAWLWEHWGTTWALRGVEQIPCEPEPRLPAGQGALGYRFWSADWTPWRALSAMRSRWPSIIVQVSVRAVSE